MSPRLALPALAAALIAGPATLVLAQPANNLQPSESIWKPAPTPPGGVAWGVLEAAKEDPAAAKAGAMKPIRRYLRHERGVPRRQVEVDGYWKRGATDFDHHDVDIPED